MIFLSTSTISCCVSFDKSFFNFLKVTKIAYSYIFEFSPDVPEI